MKVCLSLVSCLTLLVVVTHAAVIPRHERRVTSKGNAASDAEAMEEGLLRRADGRSPVHRRRHEHLHRGGPSDCPGCRQWRELTTRNSEEELIQLRIEKIKQDLLNRLGLSAPPNVSINRVPENIPDPLQYNDIYHRSGSRSDSLNDEERDELTEGHSKQIIVFAEEVEFRHRHRPSQRRHTFHFALPSEVPVHVVISAELWLYKNPDSDGVNCTNSTQTVSVHSLASDTVHHPFNQTTPVPLQPLASQEVSPHAGWFQMDLLDAVQSWRTNPRTNRGIAVEHSDCVRLNTALSHRRPFLAIGTRRGSSRRRKRDAQSCQDGTQNCCRKHSLYINFRDLGWNFIVSPQGYNANYCHGPCSVPSLQNLMSVQRRHSTILQKFSRLRNNSDMLPCCSPTSLSGLSLLYMNENGLVIREDLDNMRVESCGCS